ncbi:MAG TPA: MarR family transcriptional regulator [Pseudonocardia sp.]|nr:MarR family transcriptional regulator [Pseudonocardia sp.]
MGGPDGASRLTDSVDRIVAEWAVERPDLPMGPVEVLTRLSRVRSRVDEELAAAFGRYDLSAADFTVIAALRRAGAPYTLSQSVLMARLGLTSGTVSVRLGRLEGKGVVTRAPSSEDGRGVLVTLTGKGVELFDQVAPQHLANEDVLLSALTDDERHQLAGLLRKLLVGFEHETSTSPLGFSVAPAHLARRARTAVGLSDRSGLLVRHVEPAGPADVAGLRPGDLVVGLGEHPMLSCVDLAEASAAATAAGRPLRLQVLRGEQQCRVEICTAVPATDP